MAIDTPERVGPRRDERSADRPRHRPRLRALALHHPPPPRPPSRAPDRAAARGLDGRRAGGHAPAGRRRAPCRGIHRRRPGLDLRRARAGARRLRGLARTRRPTGARIRAPATLAEQPREATQGPACEAPPATAPAQSDHPGEGRVKPNFASEAELAKVVTTWLRADGWATFHEIECRARRAGGVKLPGATCVRAPMELHPNLIGNPAVPRQKAWSGTARPRGARCCRPPSCSSGPRRSPTSASWSASTRPSSSARASTRRMSPMEGPRAQ